MPTKYEKSPIIEAICEFILSPESKWDSTIPGLFYEKIRDIYENKEDRKIQEIELVNSPEGLRQKLTTQQRILFLTNDKKTSIQLGPNLLAVSRLNPYQSWKLFKPEINRGFTTLSSVLDVKGIQRIGLRYINKIRIPGEKIRMEDYFELRPFLGSNLPQIMKSFIVGFTLPCAGDRDSCTVQLTSAAPEQPGSLDFLLDIDYALVKPQSVLEIDALEWVENAHATIESIFEGCIKDSLREIFKEIK